MYWTDIHTLRDIDDDRIAAAFAAAFGVSVSRIAVAPRSTQEGFNAWGRPGLLALIQHGRDGEPGFDFPVTLAVGFPDDTFSVDNRPVLDMIARTLGEPMLSNLPEDPPDTWRLFWPDGTSQPVSLDDDDNVILSEADRERLRRTSHHVAAA